jgi:hypothetical protein
MKRVVRGKGCRVHSLSSSSSEVGRLLPQSAARARGSRKVGRENRKKERRHQGHNSLSEILSSGSG